MNPELPVLGTSIWFHPVERKTPMAQKQYKCEICGATLNSQAELEKHNRQMHPQYGCDICGETFSSQSELEIHTEIAHPEQAPTRSSR
jgi:transcription elongation factor Elf1